MHGQAAQREYISARVRSRHVRHVHAGAVIHPWGVNAVWTRWVPPFDQHRDELPDPTPFQWLERISLMLGDCLHDCRKLPARCVNFSIKKKTKKAMRPSLTAHLPNTAQCCGCVASPARPAPPPPQHAQHRRPGIDRSTGLPAPHRPCCSPVRGNGRQSCMARFGFINVNHALLLICYHAGTAIQDPMLVCGAALPQRAHSLIEPRVDPEPRC